MRQRNLGVILEGCRVHEFTPSVCATHCFKHVGCEELERRTESIRGQQVKDEDMIGSRGIDGEATKSLQTNRKIFWYGNPLLSMQNTF